MNYVLQIASTIGRLARFITLEGLEREIAARRPVTAEEQESLQLMLRTLEQMYGSVALGFSSEDQLLGVLVIRDDRLREAYSTDEIEISTRTVSAPSQPCPTPKFSTWD